MRNIFEGLFGKGDNNDNEKNQKPNPNEVNLTDNNAEIVKDKIDIDFDKINVNLEGKMVMNLDNLSETDLTGKFELNYNEINDKVSSPILRIMKTSEKEVQITVIDKESGIELYSDPFSIENEDGRNIKISLFDKDDESLGILLEGKEQL